MAIQLNDYHQGLMDQLNQINTMGASATADYQNLAAQQAQAKALQQAAANAALANKTTTNLNQLQSQAQVDTGSSNVGVKTPTGTGKNTFSNFLGAISQRESGGNYKAVNRDSGALGKYQIMPGNVPSWSKEALGHSITAQQFISNPAIQEKIAQYKLNYYYSKYGPAGAAVAWYAGEGTAKKYIAQNGVGFNKPQGSYSSISAYALGILRGMGLK
jgi:hypothetical protein